MPIREAWVPSMSTVAANFLVC